MLRGESYAVFIECPKGVVVKTRAKVFNVKPGVYAYVGSCGLSCSSRIIRHFSKRKKVFWHIDYLSLKCRARNSIVLRILEKKLAMILSSYGLKGVPGFGCSDDRGVETHLFMCDEKLFLEALSSCTD